MKARIYYLDNLRTFLIFLVVLIHAGIVYEPILENSWIVVDADKNNAIGLVRMYLDTFVMFSLFFISGYFLPGSIKHKTVKRFLISKFNRILLPWIVAVFTLIPAYKIIFLFSRGLPQEEWFSYFHFFTRPGGDPYFFADNPVQNWLWFLPVLFAFQVTYLVLDKTKAFSIGISMKTGVILTLFIGVIYSMLISTIGWVGWHHSLFFHFQNERLLVYFMIFLLGALAFNHGLFVAGQKNKSLFIWSNVILTFSLGIFTVVALNLFFNMVDPDRNYFFVSPAVDRTAYYLTLYVSMLSFLYILLYTFRYHFNKTGSLLSKLSNNSYYVYIIHVIVLGLIALPLLNLPVPASVKFIILTITSYIASNILVSLYLKFIQPILADKIVTIVVLVITTALTITVYSKQAGLNHSFIKKEDTTSFASPPKTGLHEAALNGNLDIVMQHVLAGSDLNITDPATGNSPLHTAAAFGRADVALALIEAGADVNFINGEGSTPLLTASFFCHVEIVSALLANGADRNIRNKDGSTALDAVSAPFDGVRGLYEYFDKTFAPLGMVIDYDYLEKTRPEVAKLLTM